jgi:integrase
VAALTLKHIQQRDGRWCIVDLMGKRRRVRTVPMPVWVKVAIDAWAGHLWVAKNGSKRSEDVIKRRYGRLCRLLVWSGTRARIPDTRSGTWHKGVSIKSRLDWLGDKRPSIPFRRNRNDGP